MPEPAKKPFYKSKRIWGLVAAAAGYLGLSDAQILADGIQPDEIVIIGGWVLALIGSIVAKKPISLK